MGGVSHLASKIGKSPAYISKRLALLELPDDIVLSINNREIKASIGEELLPIIDSDDLPQIAVEVLKNNLTTRETRRLVQIINMKPFFGDSNIEHIKTIDVLYRDKIIDIDAIALRSFDKAITTLKIALSKLSTIIEGVEDNWIVHEMLMQQKNMLNDQISVLIKEKRKL